MTDQLLAVLAEKERPWLFTIYGVYASRRLFEGVDPARRAGLRGFDIVSAGVA